ncbi:zinc ribbon domain-containing protein [Nonomuraea sp. KM90]|uniref:zinc ribbon domain-containing protein n=1 Tax=Nonomuraea sp. KM90 TaxID=3457428 RepID=UPI003FCE5002
MPDAGTGASENRVTQAAFACTACGHAAHADVNAAINILRAGLALRLAAQAAEREAAPCRKRGVTPTPAAGLGPSGGDLSRCRAVTSSTAPPLG